MKYLFIGLCMSFTLSFYGDLPVEDNYGIPRKIWQTYRTKDLPRPAADARSSWIQETVHYRGWLRRQCTLRSRVQVQGIRLG